MERIRQQLIDEINRLLELTKEILKEGMINLDRPVDELLAENECCFFSCQPRNYSVSLSNPDYARKIFGKLGLFYSHLLYLVLQLPSYAAKGQVDYCNKMTSLIQERFHLIEGKRDYKEVRDFVKTLINESAQEQSGFLGESFLQGGSGSSSYEILMECDSIGGKSLFRYGLPIHQTEINLFEYIHGLPEERLQAQAQHIAKSFLHGFISQGRDRGGRTGIPFYYQIGQEFLVKLLVKALEEWGLDPIVQRVDGLFLRFPVFQEHRYRLNFFLSAAQIESRKTALKEGFAKVETGLRNICGFIDILQFGGEMPRISNVSLKIDGGGDDLPLIQGLNRFRRQLEMYYIPPSTLSFCKVAFPNALFGDDLDNLFMKFLTLNQTESDKHEKIQQCIINALDQADHVIIKGFGENETNLQVKLQLLNDPSKETLFLNCGGDLNIPHGELFTTPELAGTSGMLHIRKINLRDTLFHNLRLIFEDGMIKDYSCENFDDSGENLALIEQILMYPYKSLPMGEFSIGTNTLVYRIAQDHNLVDQLPIILMEKMGPHFAIGDPCFARGEETPVYNLLDQKEMIARGNALTALRLKQPDEAYTDIHIDITIPYRDIGELTGYTPKGNAIAILKEGLFVLEGCEELNGPLT